MVHDIDVEQHRRIWCGLWRDGRESERKKAWMGGAQHATRRIVILCIKSAVKLVCIYFQGSSQAKRAGVRMQMLPSCSIFTYENVNALFKVIKIQNDCSRSSFNDGYSIPFSCDVSGDLRGSSRQYMKKNLDDVNGNFMKLGNTLELIHGDISCTPLHFLTPLLISPDQSRVYNSGGES